MFNAFSTETIGFARVITGVHTLIYMRKKEKKKKKERKPSASFRLKGTSRERERETRKRNSRNPRYSIYSRLSGEQITRAAGRREREFRTFSRRVRTREHYVSSDGIRRWIGRSLLLPSSIYVCKCFWQRCC